MQILPFKFLIFNSAYHVLCFLMTLSAHRFSNRTFMSSVITFCLLSFRDYISIFNAEKVFMGIFRPPTKYRNTNYIYILKKYWKAKCYRLNKNHANTTYRQYRVNSRNTNNLNSQLWLMVTDIPQLTMVRITVVLMFQRHKISAH